MEYPSFLLRYQAYFAHPGKHILNISTWTPDHGFVVQVHLDDLNSTCRFVISWSHLNSSLPQGERSIKFHGATFAPHWNIRQVPTERPSFLATLFPVLLVLSRFGTADLQRTWLPCDYHVLTMCLVGRAPSEPRFSINVRSACHKPEYFRVSWFVVLLL